VRLPVLPGLLVGPERKLPLLLPSLPVATCITGLRLPVRPEVAFLRGLWSSSCASTAALSSSSSSTGRLCLLDGPVWVGVVRCVLPGVFLAGDMRGKLLAFRVCSITLYISFQVVIRFCLPPGAITPCAIQRFNLPRPKVVAGRLEALGATGVVSLSSSPAASDSLGFLFLLDEEVPAALLFLAAGVAELAGALGWEEAPLELALVVPRAFCAFSSLVSSQRLVQFKKDVSQPPKTSN